MTEYMTEEEQIEQLKNWVKQYGLTVLAGIVIALGMVSSWHYWLNYQNRILTHASIIYDEMLTSRAQNTAASLNNANIQAEKLISHYPKTPYAQLAAFELARDAILHKNYSVAENQFTWIIDHSRNSDMRDIARIRMARVLIADKKPDAALDTAKTLANKNFAALADEVKGDAYLQLNMPAPAKEAYVHALTELSKEDAAERPLLQMKIDNLATANDINV